jgi:hypothetical protein
MHTVKKIGKEYEVGYHIYSQDDIGGGPDWHPIEVFRLKTNAYCFASYLNGNPTLDQRSVVADFLDAYSVQ